MAYFKIYTHFAGIVGDVDLRTALCTSRGRSYIVTYHNEMVKRIWFGLDSDQDVRRVVKDMMEGRI
jgi:hypothetical protein